MVEEIQNNLASEPLDNDRVSESSGFWIKASLWAKRVGLERKLAIILFIATSISGITTFSALSGDLSQANDPQLILLLLTTDFILLMALLAIVVRRLVLLWLERKRGLAGAKLHSRLVGLFSLVAVTPTIIVAVVSVGFFEFGLQGWFNEKVSTAVKESHAVAEAYLNEHQQGIVADALSVSSDLGQSLNLLIQNEEQLDAFLTERANRLNLTEAVVFDQSGQVQGKAAFSFLLNFAPEIPDFAIKNAINGEVIILSTEDNGRVRALVYLGGFDGSFLIVGRPIDPNILKHIERAKSAVALYTDLEGQRSGFVLTFAMIFAIVALMILLASVWVGLAFSNNLTGPIGNLIAAAEKVREGDLETRVISNKSEDEIGRLSRTFNLMTGELQRQQQELMSTNAQLDERTRFIEAVLGGVTAGVIGLNAKGEITLPNRSASAFFVEQFADLRGRHISVVMPEVAEFVEEAKSRPLRPVEKHIPYTQENGVQRTLLLRTVAELGDDFEIIGFVITFDDITELVSAQRKAAWSDVARRIAHEIKNPLTPIQLSAERLKRKYLKEIGSDTKTFELCIDTIIRHVTDIGTMVNEFSSFARMPVPKMKETDLNKLIKEAVFLQDTAQQGIKFETIVPDENVLMSCDTEQINRVLTNLLLNAGESIEGKLEEGRDDKAAHIKVVLERSDAEVSISIQDTGKGLPAGDREKLTEPYVTNREKGTGLGLAIVKKIMEDHGGSLVLEDNLDQTGKIIGAQAHLVFPIAS
ncbi:PAS domain-containing sensor histidine kinase [Kiloniella sp. EL199]|uniref:sensor histidine kinase NtrY-like n=1 Tax=Kiloniella sp. EL199 TaxID=2107581 RepID=UPI000EA035D5|nr:PAS domain-containing sensor histidine kinase [Kiloniella sp. EL199]